MPTGVELRKVSRDGFQFGAGGYLHIPQVAGDAVSRQDEVFAVFVVDDGIFQVEREQDGARHGTTVVFLASELAQSPIHTHICRR